MYLTYRLFICSYFIHIFKKCIRYIYCFLFTFGFIYISFFFLFPGIYSYARLERNLLHFARRLFGKCDVHKWLVAMLERCELRHDYDHDTPSTAPARIRGHYVTPFMVYSVKFLHSICCIALSKWTVEKSALTTHGCVILSHVIHRSEVEMQSFKKKTYFAAVIIEYLCQLLYVKILVLLTKLYNILKIQSQEC